MPQDTNNPRVFFFEPTKQRIDDALKFGKGEFIFDEDSPRSSIWDSETLSEEIVESLQRQHYNNERDFIAITGHFVPIAVMVAAIASHYGSFQSLLFDGVAHRYVIKTLGTKVAF